MLDLLYVEKFWIQGTAMSMPFFVIPANKQNIHSVQARKQPLFERPLLVGYQDGNRPFKDAFMKMNILINTPGGGGVLGLRTYREVPMENPKSYPVPESNSCIPTSEMFFMNGIC